LTNQAAEAIAKEVATEPIIGHMIEELGLMRGKDHLPATGMGSAVLADMTAAEATRHQLRSHQVVVIIESILLITRHMNGEVHPIVDMRVPTDRVMMTDNLEPQSNHTTLTRRRIR
jgi:hypothetical protein